MDTAEILTEITQAKATLDEVLALRDQVSQEISNVIAAVEEVRSGIAAHMATLHEQWGGLEEAHATAKSAGEASLTGIKDQVETLREQFDALRTELQGNIEETVTEMIGSLTDDLLEPVEAFREECVAKVDALVSEVADGILPDKASEVTEESLEEIREELGEMIAGTRAKLDEFRQTILQGKDKAGAGRSTAAEATEMLRTVFDPVIGELERIRSLAGAVGISI